MRACSLGDALVDAQAQLQHSHHNVQHSLADTSGATPATLSCV